MTPQSGSIMPLAGRWHGALAGRSLKARTFAPAAQSFADLSRKRPKHVSDR